MSTRSFPGKVRPGRAADHSPPFSAAVVGHTGPVTGSLYIYIYIYIICLESFTSADLLMIY